MLKAMRSPPPPNSSVSELSTPDHINNFDISPSPHPSNVTCMRKIDTLSLPLRILVKKIVIAASCTGEIVEELPSLF
jgi:hypothetical protein